MRFRSCSSASSEVEHPRLYTFEEAIFVGWAREGGMLMPEMVPRVDTGTLLEWSSLSYAELCERVLRCFVDEEEISPADLSSCIQNACSAFSQPGVVSMRRLGSALAVCELFHGPSLAFKDLGMRVLAQFLCHFLKKRGQKLNLLVGTSGDTGSSAIEAVKDLPNISLAVVYPKGRGISALQEAQIVSGEEFKNVTIFALDGGSDDIDVPIEAIFGDPKFSEDFRIGTVNSVNVCRLLVQVVHFFWSYFRIKEQSDSDSVSFSVPTGAGGHLTAAVIAREMGLPCQSITAACNINDIFHELLSRGNATPLASAIKTVSPSMDIQRPYNLERLLYMSSLEPSLTAKIMDGLRQGHQISFSLATRASLQQRCGLRSVSCADDAVQCTILNVFNSWDYVLDPHTAVGVAAALEVEKPPKHVTICMGCAHPAKFPATVSKALNEVRPESATDHWWWLPTSDRTSHLQNLVDLESKHLPTVTQLSSNARDSELVLRKYFETLA